MNRHSSKASLFLMELIISILVFSITSAICVRLFAKSHLLSRSTRELNHAVSLCESAVETFYGTNGSLFETERILKKDNLCPGMDTAILLGYDENFSPTDTAPKYILRMEETQNDSMQLFDTSVIKCDSGETVYSLHVKRYKGSNP